MTEFLESALRYAARGWSILPIGAAKKVALRTWKRYQEQRPDEQQIKRWFAGPGLHGLAVVCGPVSGGLVVRDFDTADAYDRWAQQHRILAGTLPTVRTARGYHVYLQASVTSIITVNGNGVQEGELRGAGYVLLPPSRHPTGTAYQWVVPLPDGPLPLFDPVDVGLVPETLASHASKRPPMISVEPMQQSKLRT